MGFQGVYCHLNVPMRRDRFKIPEKSVQNTLLGPEMK